MAFVPASPVLARSTWAPHPRALTYRSAPTVRPVSKSTSRSCLIASAAPKSIKFTYFDSQWRDDEVSNGSRGIDFEDVRIKRDDWESVKPTTPFQAVPVLTVDGERFAQSQAILKYVGKLGGLYPTDFKLALFSDEILYTFQDLTRGMIPFIVNKSLSEEKRKSKMLAVFDRFWGGCERRLNEMPYSKNGPYVLGDQMSIADLAVFTAYTTIVTDLNYAIDAEALAKYPRMQTIALTVMSLPSVVAWYEKNPIKPQFGTITR